MNLPDQSPTFDRSAAITRSLLGYGVLAGVFYMTAALILGLTRDGFDFSAHPLSILMLGEGGWMQSVNLIVTGAMVIAAAAGFARSMDGSASARRTGVLIGIFGVALIGSAIFPPDPMVGFPPGTETTEASMSGILHLALGAIGFLCLAAAGLVVAGWFSKQSLSGMDLYSRISAAIIAIGFVAAATVPPENGGILALWIAVVTAWLWLGISSATLYRSVPHPDVHRRMEMSPNST